MSILLMAVGIPITYLILAAANLLPADIGLFVLVIVNCAACSFFHVRSSDRLLKRQAAQLREANPMEPQRAIVTSVPTSRST